MYIYIGELIEKERERKMLGAMIDAQWIVLNENLIKFIRLRVITVTHEPIIL
jgi:hypothetical protein